jgi:hypothetical protein
MFVVAARLKAGRFFMPNKLRTGLKQGGRGIMLILLYVFTINRFRCDYNIIIILNKLCNFNVYALYGGLVNTLESIRNFVKVARSAGMLVGD